MCQITNTNNKWLLKKKVVIGWFWSYLSCVIVYWIHMIDLCTELKIHLSCNGLMTHPGCISGSYPVFQDKVLMKTEWMNKWLYENSPPRLTKAIFVLCCSNVHIINSILIYACYKTLHEISSEHLKKKDTMCWLLGIFSAVMMWCWKKLTENI